MPQIFNLSPQCKAFVVKKVYEHYTMNILWKEVCQKGSIIGTFIFSVISLFSQSNSSFTISIVFISSLLSLLVSSFCDTKELRSTFYIVEGAYTTPYTSDSFDDKFRELIPYIRDIDFARGRSEYAALCKESGFVQLPCDKLTNHDVDEMNRQRYIIAVLCSMVVIINSLVLFLLPGLDAITKIILTFITVTTIVGFVAMLIDCKWISKKENK